jgi:SAM-dependent methyltransferase
MSLARNSLIAVKQRLGRPYRYAQRNLEHVVFERGLQSTWTSDISSGYLFVARGLWGRRVSTKDVFLDYGSGNGRVLLAAGRFRFGRIIGLEQNAPECEFARSNARIAAPRLRCPNIEVIEGDATVWPVPDDVTYIYMFNPFWGEVFQAMLARVFESLERRPRELTIIYAYPTCAQEMLDTGRFERVRVSRGPRRNIPQQRIEVFRALPAPAAP